MRHHAHAGLKIQELSLRHFRNWEELELAPGEGLNLWTAPNGAGKTNVLEALAFLMSGQSPRTRHPSHLVRFESPAALARARLRGEAGPGGGVEVSCRIEARGMVHFFKNGKEISTRRMRPHFPAVYFSPEEVSVISGEPRIRRDFLDRALKVLVPTYADTFQDYHKALAGRNALLLRFQDGDTSQELSVWDEALAAYGAEIVFRRRIFLEQISQAKGRWQDILRIPGEVTFRYPHGLVGMKPEEIARALLKRMQDLKDAERAAGQSLVGPHRDEIEISLSGHSARTFGSRGEIRLLSLLLVLSVASLIEEKLEEAPVLLLDDVFSELDEAHQSAVVFASSSRFQVIATTADVSLARRISPQHLVNLALKARVAA